MTTYLVLVGLHFLTLLRNSKILILLSFILLYLVMGFRDPLLGTDAQNYENTFYFISQDVDVQLEPLWIFLNKVIYFFGGDYSDVIWLSSLLMLIPVYSACLLVNKKYFIFFLFLFLTLYYYFYGFNIIRQGIGMSWGLLFLVQSHQIVLVGVPAKVISTLEDYLKKIQPKTVNTGGLPMNEKREILEKILK